jgi:D-alanyl-D-alanine dipeptidase
MRSPLRILPLLVLIPVFTSAQTADDELVNVKELIPDIVLDLKYGTMDNFLSQKMYTANECLFAHGAVKHLKLVQDSLRTMGLGLKIWDAYRPRAVQYLMWEIYPNPTYVADPATGSNHNRGAAVDLTLVSLSTGQELPMPTPFDWFGDEAGHDWTIGLTADQIANRALLKSMMENVGGFTSLNSEWWHYTYSPALENPLMDFQMK